jgi:D-xylose transport system ATP-binding protein
MTVPVLRLAGISKSFGAVRALQEVEFEVSAGQVVALVGDNGAGKSTLVKAIAGVVPPDEGRIEFLGREAQIRAPHDATALGIATVYQDLALCDNLDVVNNLFLGREEVIGAAPKGPSWLKEIAMEQAAHRLLDRLSVHLPELRRPISALSGGQRQSIAVARSLLGEPKLVLLDEPTAALGVAQTAQVLSLISRLRDEELAVVLVSHNLADVFSVADRITVLRLGRNAGSFAVASARHNEVVAAITGAPPEGSAAPTASEVGG